MNKFKKVIYILLFIIATFILTACFGEIDNIELNGIDLDQIEDGEYIGECNTTLVSAKVKVVVTRNKIDKIELLKHDNGRGEKAETIVDSVLDNQRTKVDMISGATGSSKAILKAIEDALSR
ncbi:MAG: FMN-binding protein [Halanaerobiales bacterium]